MQKIAFLFIATGLLSILYSIILLIQRYNPNRLMFHGKVPAFYSDQTNKNVPIAFRIPELGIDLPVIPAYIKKDKWDTTTGGISWLIASPIPGELGNSILYGHNWNTLLGDLENAKPGYTVEILYKNSVKRYFRISYIAIVNLDQIHVLSPTDDARLTIYTCTGFLDQKRLVVTAEYQPSTNANLSTSL